MLLINRFNAWLPIAALSLTLSACADPDPEVGVPDASVDMSAEPDAQRTDAASGDAGATDTGSTGDLGRGEDAGVEMALSIERAATCNVGMPARSVTPGDDLIRVTLDDPLAVCNDGTPGVFYVRPGSGAGADKWVIWLEGGGGCADPATCMDRWCGSVIPHTASKMSSRWAPEGVKGIGVFNAAPATGTNRFADWNQVLAYYCSSDGWAGQIDHPRIVDESRDGLAYSLRFRGRKIVEATLESLQAGSVSDDGQVTMPSIDDASLVLLSGTSAGGAGVRLNGDAVGETLKSANADLDYRLVVDAGVWPKLPNDSLTLEDSEAYFDRTGVIADEFKNSFTDASCLAFHADDPKYCFDATHVLVHHAETPSFAKMDYRDPVNSPGLYPDETVFAQETFRLLSDLANGAVVTEESGLAGVGGIFAPNCQHHVAMEVPDFYSIQIAAGMNPTGLSFHDVLANWVDGDDPVFVLDDRQDAYRSICPR